MKALIIDDETDICYLLSKLLRQEHLEPECVSNLSDASVVLKKINPEIIFLDNHLPDGLGMNFLKHIRKDHPNAKIVMITAHDMSTERQRALSTGADDFIGKPFTPAIIHRAVTQLMN